MGARNDDMGNTCELLINIVMWSKPKVLIGLDQKVRGMERALYFSYAVQYSPGGKANLNKNLDAICRVTS